DSITKDLYQKQSGAWELMVSLGATGENIGVSGESVFAGIESGSLQFKSVKAGANLSVETTEDNEIQITSLANTAVMTTDGTRPNVDVVQWYTTGEPTGWIDGDIWI